MGVDVVTDGGAVGAAVGAAVGTVVGTRVTLVAGVWFVPPLRFALAEVLAEPDTAEASRLRYEPSQKSVCFL